MKAFSIVGITLIALGFLAGSAAAAAPRRAVPARNAVNTSVAQMRKNAASKGEILSPKQMTQLLAQFKKEYLRFIKTLPKEQQKSDILDHVAYVSANPYEVAPLLRLVLVGQTIAKIQASQRKTKADNRLTLILNKLQLHLLKVAEINDDFIDKARVVK